MTAAEGSSGGSQMKGLVRSIAIVSLVGSRTAAACSMDIGPVRGEASSIGLGPAFSKHGSAKVRLRSGDLDTASN